MKDNKETKKRLSIELSVDEHTEIKVAAAERGITIKELIEEALCAFAQMEKNE